MSKKNNKQTKNKPAVGSPAAGSNNKRAKNKPVKAKLDRKKAVAIAVAGVVAVAVAVLVIIFTQNLDIPSSVRDAEFKGRLEPSSVATEIALSPTRQKKLADSVNARGNNGAFDFYVNEEITLDEHGDPVLIEFGNIESNDCVLVAFLLDENGEVIYRSLGIEPGEEIRTVRLFDSVSYGTHNATLVVNGYNSESYRKLGTQTVDINLKIGVDSVEK